MKLEGSWSNWLRKLPTPALSGSGSRVFSQPHIVEHPCFNDLIETLFKGGMQGACPDPFGATLSPVPKAGTLGFAQDGLGGTLRESVFGPAVHSSLEGAAVHAGQGGCNLVGEERVVAGGDEEFRDAPDVFFRGHPMLAVQAGEVDGRGVGAKGAFAAEVVVVIEVARGPVRAESGRREHGSGGRRSWIWRYCPRVRSGDRRRERGRRRGPPRGP